MYASGFQQLHRMGELELFFMSHDDASDNTAIHTTPQNFFWHSYWLWELESSFRRLGGEYECFTMPYWDVTHDAEYWEQTENPQINDLPIYNSNLGKDGNIENDYCVEEAPWSVDDYTTTYLCADDEESPNCCLKRYHQEVENSQLSNRSDLASILYVDPQYAEFNEFAKQINKHHMKIHTFIGSVEQHTHFNPSKGEPEVDPLFPLFHTFIDYIRLLREDCYQFDLLAADDLDEAIPFAYSQSDNQTLDYVMTFSVLCDGTDSRAIEEEEEERAQEEADRRLEAERKAHEMAALVADLQRMRATTARDAEEEAEMTRYQEEMLARVMELHQIARGGIIGN